MRFVTALRRRFRQGSLAGGAWTLLACAAWAQEKAAAPAGADTKSYALSYLLIGLATVLGLIGLARPSTRAFHSRLERNQE